MSVLFLGEIMRKVKIKLPEKNADGKFRIYLSEDYNFTFSDKRKAKDFITKLNHFLTEVVEDLNEQYIELFVLYRKYYFYFNH